MAATELIRVDRARGVATLTLDSPHNRNALSTPLMTRLLAELDSAAADEAVRVVVITHTGPVFCSGADLSETAAGVAPTGLLSDVLAAIWESPKPVVARVGGAARAGGLGLVAAADIAICADEATFAFSEVRIGVVPAIISGTVLRRLAPRAAAELFLTGDVFDGRRAAEIGLVTAAAPAEALDATVASYCGALLRGGPLALAGTKKVLHRPPAATVREDLADLAALSAEYFGSDEGREGVLAFREKRAPRWVPDE
ncbi:enoyl-CoA hydratase-related protein [Micromonospora sp. CPCC 206061]|uniref:enoyl-CoA hydratase-related protein n=1 Tax=Micromonospora sp. CPCC 206061 TaxID=3122410 RepID=UPI002FF06B2C